MDPSGRATGPGRQLASSRTESDEVAMADADVIARRVVVRGAVQGVFFRASTRQQAEACGVAGWVRNLPDGSVEAHLEGREDDVEEVLGWMRSGGPRNAIVREVDVRAELPAGDVGFEVRR